MGYSATTGDILYWKPDQHFVIQGSYRILFNGYTPGFLLLQQYPESRVHNSDLLNLIPCELHLIFTPFCDKTILTHEIYLPPHGKVCT